jgi:glutathione S-transferase
VQCVTAELLGIAYSPWTDKARWSLDVRRVPYVFKRYQPLLGEPALRRKVGRLVGRVSVPVLTTEAGRVIEDSAAIARWADGQGEGPALFPSGKEREVARFVELSERALAAGRAISLDRMLQSEEALTELVPRPIRKRLGRRAWAVGWFGIWRTLRKYDGQRASAEVHRATLVEILDELRRCLGLHPSPSGPRTVLGTFSFADVAMAEALTYVDPAPDLEIGTASRRAFVDEALRERYRDLLDWRDDLRRAYRSELQKARR